MGDLLNGTIVNTSAGWVRGERRGRGARFRGIPYGAPVTGEARFRPAAPAQPWPGIWDARELGPACPQNRNAAMGLFALPEIQALIGPAVKFDQPTNENCLALNVWTHALEADAGRKPVMVWLHGGGVFAGSSGSAPYDGERLSAIGDVVVVSLNHRLNVFGFLYLGDIGGEDYRCGNVGMLDIVLALKWVRDNISGFGGDPNNITIFGESGGGQKVSILGSMPECVGLFHKAIVQSGSTLTALSTDAATTLADKFIHAAGFERSEWRQLLNLPTAELVAASVSDPTLRAIGPVTDGVTLSQANLFQIPPVDGGVVPMIIGTTRDEARLLYAEDEAAFSVDYDGLQKRVAVLTSKTPADVDCLIAAYNAAHPGASFSDIFFFIGTDLAFRNKAVRQAEYRVAMGAKVYMYRFDWPSSLFDGKYGAIHGIDIPFVFHRPDSLGAVGQSPARFALADAVSNAWARFSWTGDPNHPELPTWPCYDLAKRPTMIFDEKIVVAPGVPIIEPLPALVVVTTSADLSSEVT
jgi:para-nitrobenzyl esterase